MKKNSPLIENAGKRKIVTQLKKSHSHIIHVGDGLNDLVTYDLVTRFIGYGGVFYRENIAERCNYYIRSLSLAPLLPLILTSQEVAVLNLAESELYQKGLNAIHAGYVKVK